MPISNWEQYDHVCLDIPSLQKFPDALLSLTVVVVLVVAQGWHKGRHCNTMLRRHCCHWQLLWRSQWWWWHDLHEGQHCDVALSSSSWHEGRPGGGGDTRGSNMTSCLIGCAPEAGTCLGWRWTMLRVKNKCGCVVWTFDCISNFGSLKISPCPMSHEPPAHSNNTTWRCHPIPTIIKPKPTMPLPLVRSYSLQSETWLISPPRSSGLTLNGGQRNTVCICHPVCSCANFYLSHRSHHISSCHQPGTPSCYHDIPPPPPSPLGRPSCHPCATTTATWDGGVTSSCHHNHNHHDHNHNDTNPPPSCHHHRDAMTWDRSIAPSCHHHHYWHHHTTTTLTLTPPRATTTTMPWWKIAVSLPRAATTTTMTTTMTPIPSHATTTTMRDRGVTPLCHYDHDHDHHDHNNDDTDPPRATTTTTLRQCWHQRHLMPPPPPPQQCCNARSRHELVCRLVRHIIYMILSLLHGTIPTSSTMSSTTLSYSVSCLFIHFEWYLASWSMDSMEPDEENNNVLQWTTMGNVNVCVPWPYVTGCYGSIHRKHVCYKVIHKGGDVNRCNWYYICNIVWGDLG